MASITALAPDGPAVTVRGLDKRFGATKALDGVDLDVAQGTVLGVLGPNGAGKTTLVRILSTLARPDAGTARVAGYDVLSQPRQVRRAIGLTGQYASVDEKLSGRENLYLIGRLLDLSRRQAKQRADEMLERFSLTAAAGRPTGQYSGGMRRRLDLAASMVGRPAVLFLDEPTTGLDPRTRNDVWQEVRRMVADGSTVLLTTQYMAEAEELAHELAVFEQGRVIAAGGVRELKARIGGRRVRIRPADPGRLPAMAQALADAGMRSVITVADEPEAETLDVPVLDDRQLTEVVAVLAAAGITIADVSTHLPSLDEVFLAVTDPQPAGGRTVTGLGPGATSPGTGVGVPQQVRG